MHIFVSVDESSIQTENWGRGGVALKYGILGLGVISFGVRQQPAAKTQRRSGHNNMRLFIVNLQNNYQSIIKTFFPWYVHARTALFSHSLCQSTRVKYEGF